MSTSIQDELVQRNNSHTSSTRSWEAYSGIGWHDPTPSDHPLAAMRTVSVVIPAFQVGYCLPAVLNALHAQHHRYGFEVIVVDDASTDDTGAIAAAHPIVSRAVRLRERMGTATARNLGTILARGQSVLYLDGDMVVPPHVITDIAARASETSVLVGFRHNLRYEVHQGGATALAHLPQLEADHRVVWRPPVGRPLPYSGITLTKPLDGRPLDHTNDLVDLGHGQRYYDWDLPRMVVGAMFAAPREAVLNVGGFNPEFGRVWGMEDTYLGACLIAAELLVIPLRQAVGFHLDPPDAAEQWQRKLASWPATLTRYWDLIRHHPPPNGRAHEFTASTTRLLHSCEVLR